MRCFLRSTGLAILLLASSTAYAQSDYVDIEKRLTAEQCRATGLDTLSDEQLTLLNALLRDSEAKQLAEARGEEARAVVARDRPARPEPHGSGDFIGLNDAPIRSRVKGDVGGWEPGYVFQLENGQQWKVLKGKMTLSKPLQSPEIVVVPGIAGRWFLQVSEDMPKPRVYRID
ncbi:MAG: hypothetical protein ABL934_19135 [Lysobacteraceae bacterium]